jgi:MoxR-like ATPase
VRLVYLSGEPGAGKSTLMRELTRRYERIPLLAVHGAPARDALVDVDAPPPLSYGEPQRWAAVELGKRRAAFSGTDALPQAVITDAEEERRAKRAAELGKPPQNASWVKGRITAARNLTLTAPARGAEVLLLDSSTATPSALAAAVRLGVPELR